MEIANKMRCHGEKIEDVTIVEKILHSMTREFNYVVCSIEELNDINDLSLDELQSSLLVHEQKMNRSLTANEQALKASTTTHSNNSRRRGRGRGRGRGDRGHRDGSRNKDDKRNFKANNEQFQGKGRGRDHGKSKVECFRCHKYGHYAVECYTRLPNDKEKGENSNFVEDKKEVETLLMSAHEGKKIESDMWYVDTSCSNHMSRSKSSFANLDENFHSTVSFGDSSTLKVMGKRDIKIQTKNGFVEMISNVMYVLDLKNNLLSIG